MGSVTKRIRRNITENLTGYRGSGNSQRYRTMSDARKNRIILMKQGKHLTSVNKPEKQKTSGLKVYRTQAK